MTPRLILALALAATCVGSVAAAEKPSPPHSASPSTAPADPGSHPKKWEHRAATHRALREGPDGGIAHDAFLAQWEARQREVDAHRANIDPSAEGPKAAGISRAGWTAVGPGNVPGRARGIAIDPVDPNLIYVGAASGGIWKTVDGGANWAPLTDDMATLVINTVAIDPNDRNVLYAATGEESTGFYGAGVFKSTNAGATWAPVAANGSGWAGWGPNPDPNFAGKGTHRLSLHPTNSGTMLVATFYGIFRSTDGGASFSRTYPLSLASGSSFYFDNSVSTVYFNPRNGNEAIAATYDGRVGVSRDGGQTWAFTSVQPRTDRLVRMEVAFAPSVPGKLYALYGPREGQLHVSLNYGQTWSLGGNLPTADQGFDRYKNTLWVSPVDDKLILAGALNLYASRDGGVTWGQYMNSTGGLENAIHVDIHYIATQAGYGSGGNKRLWVATDGGVYALGSSDTPMPSTGVQADGWRHLNGGMTTSQAYHIHGDVTRRRIAMGTQDNGAIWYRDGLDSERSWQKPRTGGDVMRIWVDPGSNYSYYTYQFLEVARLDGDTGRWERICDGLGDTYNDPTGLCGFFRTGASQPKANFLAPLNFDNIGAGRLLAGGRELWRSLNPRAPAVTWASIKGPIAGDSLISAIGSSAAVPDHVWAGHNNGAVYRSTNASASQPTFQAVSGLPSRRVTSFHIDASNPSNVLVTFAGTAQNTSNLWSTRDGGATWQQLGSSLPRVAFLSVTRHPLKREYIYVGTDLGIYASEDDGATFQAINDGPANVIVYSLGWYGDRELLAGTHGRGVWKATVNVTGSVANPTGLWWSFGENGWGMNFNLQAGLLFGALYTYDTDGSPLWLVLSVGQGSGGSYTGPLFRATGPAFNASPWVWDPATRLQQVGTMTASFSSAEAGTLSYTVNGAQVNKTITRFRFGTPPYTTCSATSGSRAGLTNYQDLWENAPGGSEPGWGLNIAHEDDRISANLYTYDATGKGLWLILSDAPKQADGSYSGALYSVRGPAFNTAPWPAAGTVVTQVGTMTLRFTNGETGTMSYTVNGVAVSKNITRSIFAPSSRPACGP